MSVNETASNMKFYFCIEKEPAKWFTCLPIRPGGMMLALINIILEVFMILLMWTVEGPNSKGITVPINICLIIFCVGEAILSFFIFFAGCRQSFGMAHGFLIAFYIYIILAAILAIVYMCFLDWKTMSDSEYFMRYLSAIVVIYIGMMIFNWQMAYVFYSMTKVMGMESPTISQFSQTRTKSGIKVASSGDPLLA
jgi:hypothetical protein